MAATNQLAAEAEALPDLDEYDGMSIPGVEVSVEQGAANVRR